MQATTTIKNQRIRKHPANKTGQNPGKLTRARAENHLPSKIEEAGSSGPEKIKHKPITITTKIGDADPIQMVMDTGAAYSVMGVDWYIKNKLKLPTLEHCPFSVSTADGSKTPIVGFIPKTNMVVNEQEISAGLLILENRRETKGLLGLDALAQVDAIFNLKERSYVNIKKNEQGKPKRDEHRRNRNKIGENRKSK
jgi:hypothetical protein